MISSSGPGSRAPRSDPSSAESSRANGAAARPSARSRRRARAIAAAARTSSTASRSNRERCLRSAASTDSPGSTMNRGTGGSTPAVNRLTCRSDTENAAASSATVSPLRRLLRSSSTAMSSNFTEDHPFPSDVDRCPAMSECPGPRTGEGYGDCGSHERISSRKERVRRDGRHGFLRARHLRDSASRRLYSRSSELGGDAVSASRGIRIEPPGVTRIEGNVPLRTPR